MEKPSYELIQECISNLKIILEYSDECNKELIKHMLIVVIDDLKTIKEQELLKNDPEFNKILWG